MTHARTHTPHTDGAKRASSKSSALRKQNENRNQNKNKKQKKRKQTKHSRANS